MTDHRRTVTPAPPQASDEFEAADALPERCPYTLDRITGDWLPGPAEPLASCNRARLRADCAIIRPRDGAQRMATRTKPVPAPADAYEQDFDAWAQTQAELLRAGRFDELDLANLIEEVAGLGGSLHRKVRNRALTIMVHLTCSSSGTRPRPPPTSAGARRSGRGAVSSWTS